jgi:hypothetical protein
VAWARLDDAFDDHPKVLALLDMDGAAAAIGLWTLCLTYAHRNTRKKGKTPGLIPFTLPRRFFGPEGRSMAALLVEVGLWDEVEDGWMIHDFAEYLPAKEVSEARSAAGKKGAAKRWGNKPTPPDGNGMAEPKQDDDKPMAPPKQDDGNLPSDDGSLPPEDDNAVASDGSRARARRDRVDVRTTVLFPGPTPEPVPPSAGTAPPRRDPSKPINAGDVVGAYVEGAKEGSQPHPAESLRKRIGRQAGQLLKEKTPPDALLTAARNAGASGWSDLAVQLQRDAANSKVRELRPTGTGGHVPYSNPDPSDYYEDL